MKIADQYRQPFPNSQKIYVQSPNDASVNVAMRDISLQNKKILLFTIPRVFILILIVNYTLVTAYHHYVSRGLSSVRTPNAIKDETC